MAAKDGICTQCGAPVEGGARTCPYCGVPYWKEERAANQLGNVINPIDARMMPVSYSYEFNNCAICCTMDAIRAAQNQQIDCNAADWLRRQAAQCQNAIPYTPTPRPVCKEPEDKRKPFENDMEGLAIFIFILILAIVCFSVAALVLSPVVVFDGSAPHIGKAVLFLLFCGLGVFLAFVAKMTYTGEYP